MTEFERINAPRVEKILGMLEVINKSARSNKVEEDEISQLLSPIFGNKPSPRIHPNELINLAKTAPLSDAVSALQVITARIDEELWQWQKS